MSEQQPGQAPAEQPATPPAGQQAPGPQPTQQQIIEAIYHFAAEQMRAGLSGPQVEAKLMEQGLDQEAAAIVVKNLEDARKKVRREAGVRHMVIGGLFCIGGIIVTAVTYSAAAAGGGSYVVAWGAIAFGAIEFLIGLSQVASG